MLSGTSTAESAIFLLRSVSTVVKNSITSICNSQHFLASIQAFVFARGDIHNQRVSIANIRHYQCAVVHSDCCGVDLLEDILHLLYNWKQTAVDMKKGNVAEKYKERRYQRVCILCSLGDTKNSSTQSYQIIFTQRKK